MYSVFDNSKKWIFVGLFVLVVFHGALFICVFSSLLYQIAFVLAVIWLLGPLPVAHHFVFIYLFIYFQTHSGDVNLGCIFTWAQSCGFMLSLALFIAKTILLEVP